MEDLDISQSEIICGKITGSHIRRCIVLDDLQDAGMSMPTKIYTDREDVRKIRSPRR